MTKEAARSSSQPDPTSLINPDGSIHAANLWSRFGLQERDVAKTIEYGRFKGTVAEMLNDQGCPVGGMLERTFAKKGIAGLAQKFGDLREEYEIDFGDVSSETIVINQDPVLKAELEERLTQGNEGERLSENQKKNSRIQIFPPTQSL